MKRIYGVTFLLLAGILQPIVAVRPTRTAASPSITSVMVQPTPTDFPETIAKRCNPGESCPDVTAGPEVPIAVTTTMMTTKIVPCTTTTTVIDSTTSTLTLWSTSVQTETVSIKGAQTVTVWLITPAPSIIASTYSTDEVLTFTKARTATTFWTSTAPVQTIISTIDGGESTWTIGSQTSIIPAPVPVPPPPSPSICQTCSQVASGIAPAWTQTTAGFPAISSAVWAPPPPPPPVSSTTATGVAPGAFGTVSNTIPFGGTPSPSVSPSMGQSPPPGSPSITGTIYANQGSPFITNDGVVDIRPNVEMVALAGAILYFALR